MLKNTGKYYLYRHIRLDKNEPFYIGIGTKGNKINTNLRSDYINRGWKQVEYIKETVVESYLF